VKNEMSKEKLTPQKIPRTRKNAATMAAVPASSGLAALKENNTILMDVYALVCKHQSEQGFQFVFE
jgi:hypothetical protein